MGPLRALGRFIEKHSPLIAAVLTLVAALLGVMLALVSQDRTETQDVNHALEAKVARLERENGDLVSEVNRRDGQIDDLAQTVSEQEQELEKLRGESGNAGPPSERGTALYQDKIVKVQLDGCDRGDDIDLDVPEHPTLASDSELDFSSCMQGATYAEATNGGVIFGAATAASTRDDCLAAVEEEPDEGNGIEVERGAVMCVSSIDQAEGLRIFRVRVLEFAGDPRMITLSVTGWPA